jgi:hypothetical protein
MFYNILNRLRNRLQKKLRKVQKLTLQYAVYLYRAIVYPLFLDDKNLT